IMKRFVSALILAILFSIGYIASPGARQAAASSATVVQSAKTFEEMVPMRDGVKLSTIIFLPDGDGPWPVVLERTPYGKTSQLMSAGGGAKPWTSHGFAFVVQDVRGMFKSEGKYRPFVDDSNDGYDTVEWAAKQTWSNGRIGMFGASAMGITTNMAAMMNPPHLLAGFVMVARSSIYHQSSFMGGVFRKEMNDRWLKLVKSESTLDEIYKHAVYDGYSDAAEMYKHWGEVRIPIYNYGGWYDIFDQGDIDNFVGLQATGGGLAAGNQKLIMGPWGHGNLEEVHYPANAGIGAFGGTLSTELALRWFDYWLKGIDNEIMQEPPVRYYVMGDVSDPKAPGNEWRTALSWPVPARQTSFFLEPGGLLSEKIAPDRESTDAYAYDPKNPVPTIGGGNLFEKKGPMDQRAIGDRKDVLKYSTPVLASPVEVTGRVGVELWIESDAPDTDFMAKLVDVYPDGTERLVLDSAVRARFRDGFDHEVFMKKGQVYKVNIDLWSTSLIFNKGHRIAIHVSSSNNPRFDPNPNTGKPLRADSETRIANNVIHHDRMHPSRALLPIVPAGGLKEAPRSAN
ncbi:MAG TPA: CocE/NonD family hydrolase, partial [Blastocatellia bacterium]|nr:CocE/NonD family hydrolase [Blastocatellia bacterium]